MPWTGSSEPLCQVQGLPSTILLCFLGFQLTHKDPPHVLHANEMLDLGHRFKKKPPADRKLGTTAVTTGHVKVLGSVSTEAT